MFSAPKDHDDTSTRQFLSQDLTYQPNTSRQVDTLPCVKVDSLIDFFCCGQVVTIRILAPSSSLVSALTSDARLPLLFVGTSWKCIESADGNSWKLMETWGIFGLRDSAWSSSSEIMLESSRRVYWKSLEMSA